VALPVEQCTLQLPVSWHSTRQSPVHVTLQLPTLRQVTTLPGPTSGAQSFELTHSYVQPAPHDAWHVLVLSHRA
jgi:hypothetical protein